MKRREFLRSVAILPIMGIVPEIVRPKAGSREWWGSLSNDYTFGPVEPLFHLCKERKEGQLPEPVESMGCKTALRDLKDTLGCFATPHIVEVTCPECLTIMEGKN